MEAPHGGTVPPGSSQRHPYLQHQTLPTETSASLKGFLPPAPQKVDLLFLL